MSKQLRVRTEYDLVKLEELQRVVTNSLEGQRTRIQRSSQIILGVLGLLGGAFLVLVLEKPIHALVWSAVAVIMLLMGVFFYWVRAWRSSRAMGLHKQPVINDFVFEKTTVLVFVGNQSARYAYADCVWLLEAELAFYMILKNGQGLMMDKSGISGGTVDDLRAWLEEKCEATTQWVGRGKKPS